MFKWFKNRRRRYFVTVVPSVYTRLKFFADSYNISVKASIQVLLQQNLATWETEVRKLQALPAKEERDPSSGRVKLPDGREIMSRL